MAAHQPNRRERMDLILERDGPWCVWCSAPLDASPGALNPPTTEHMVPRIKGGPSWVENELAACRRCNNERGGLRRARPYIASQLRRLRRM